MNRRFALKNLLAGLCAGITSVVAAKTSEAAPVAAGPVQACRCCGKTENLKQRRFGLKIEVADEEYIQKLGGRRAKYQAAVLLCKDDPDCADWFKKVMAMEFQSWYWAKMLDNGASHFKLTSQLVVSDY